ncbi:hypothetical protein ACSFA0_24755 [Variovorax sp. LT1P1]|uniref:hypothetical protein n=1 Tax=Variovorax sp. LT1P1 TaxID=3443730 RepID=UPI003F46FB9B
MARLVYQTAEGRRLIGGLDWRLLAAKGSLDSRLREGASGNGATHATVASALTPEKSTVKGKQKEVIRLQAGFFTALDGSKPEKGSHSLAGAFASWARQHPAALLNVKTADGAYAVVVVINGLPVLDRVEEDSTAAFLKAQPYLQERSDISVFSDDTEKYPRSLMSTDLLQQIAGATTKGTALRPVPINAARVAVIGLIVLGAAGGFVYHSKWKAEKARKEALARQRAADPIPKYLNALAAAREGAGLQRAALQAGFAAAQRLPVAPDGWRATRIGCSATAGCEVQFFRTTGTLASLRAAMPGLELSPSSQINLNEARMTWKQELPMQRLEPSQQLMGLGAFLQSAEASKLQMWLVAGPSVQLTPPQLWPQVPGVPQSFKHPQALAAGKFEVSSVALPQVVEALATAPSNVAWTGWSVDIGDAKQEPLSRAKARLTGTFYVKND